MNHTNFHCVVLAPSSMEEPTRKQLDCIFWYLIDYQAKYSRDIEKKVETMIDRGAASDIIDAFKKGNDGIAFAQIEHLIGESIKKE